MPHINGFDHVQVAMPVGAEDAARAVIFDVFGNRIELIERQQGV